MPRAVLRTGVVRTGSFQDVIEHQETNNVRSLALSRKRGLQTWQERQRFWPVLLDLLPVTSEEHARQQGTWDTHTADAAAARLVDELHQHTAREAWDSSQILKDVERSACYFPERATWCLRVLFCVLDVVFSRHAHQGLLYTQGIHEAAALLVRVFDDDTSTGTDDHATMAEDATPQHVSLTDWKTRSQNGETAVVITTVQPLVATFERLCLYHFADLLAAPLDITMMTRLGAVGVLLWTLDRPLYSLLTAVSQWNRVVEGCLTEETLSCHLRGSQFRYACCSGWNDCRGPVCSTDMWDLQCLTGHEFQFCLSWLLTFFTHDLLPWRDGNPELCARIWDALLAAPPSFCIYLAACLIRWMRRDLFQLGQRYGLQETTASSSSRRYFPRQLREHCSDRTLVASNAFYGLTFDPTTFRADAIDFLAVDIFGMFQTLFRGNASRTLDVVEHAIQDALWLMKGHRPCQRKYSLPTLVSVCPERDGALGSDDDAPPVVSVHRLCPNCLWSSFPLGDGCWGLPPFSSLHYPDWPWRMTASSRSLLETRYEQHFDPSAFVAVAEKLIQAKQRVPKPIVPESLFSAWSIQGRLFVSLLANRALTRLIVEWRSIMQRLIFASQHLTDVPWMPKRHHMERRRPRWKGVLGHLSTPHASRVVVIAGMFGAFVSWAVWNIMRRQQRGLSEL